MPRRDAPSGFALYRAWDGVLLPHGQFFKFSDTPVSDPISRLFRIENQGRSTLNISNFESLVSGTAFSQIETPAATVPPGAETTFRVRFFRHRPGQGSGRIRIDTGRGRYVVRLTGSAGASDAARRPTARPLFVLSDAERLLWTPGRVTGYQPPPACTLTRYSWSGTAGGALK